MLQRIRDGLQGQKWLTWLILGGIAATFVLWGGAGSLDLTGVGSNTAAEVNGEEIPASEATAAWNRTQQMYSRQLGTDVPEDRKAEIQADIILKATKVEGVYSADPMLDANATRYDCITYQEVLERQLKVMDASAISLCMDNNLPIIVFNMRQAGNITRVVAGEPVGTKVFLAK
jgi:hypothetical protein